MLLQVGYLKNLRESLRRWKNQSQRRKISAEKRRKSTIIIVREPILAPDAGKFTGTCLLCTAIGNLSAEKSRNFHALIVATERYEKVTSKVIYHVVIKIFWSFKENAMDECYKSHEFAIFVELCIVYT